jgi:hypothetical protein
MRGMGPCSAKKRETFWKFVVSLGKEEERRRYVVYLVLDDVSKDCPFGFYDII